MATFSYGESLKQARKENMIYSCRICRSEFRAEIERRLTQKEGYRVIARDYIDKFGCNLHALEQSISKHNRHMGGAKEGEIAPAVIKNIVQNFSERLERGEKITYGDFAEVVTQIGLDNVLKKPGLVKPRDVLGVEALKIQREKEVRQTNAMKLTLAHFFGGIPLTCPYCGGNVFKTTEYCGENVFKTTEFQKVEIDEKYLRESSEIEDAEPLLPESVETLETGQKILEEVRKG